MREINAMSSSEIEPASEKGHQIIELNDSRACFKDMPLGDLFSEWNLRLLQSFFSEASRDEEVFLRVDKEFLDQIGQDIGGDVGFMKAVREGPSWGNKSHDLVEGILKLVRHRRVPCVGYKDPETLDSTYRDVNAPAYLPFLAALVRNYSENSSSYYEGLRVDLGLSHEFGPNEMDRVETAWDDLEKWTERNRGRFGFFKLRRLGGYRLIGVPRSQSILKPHDVENLARAFVQAQVAPGYELTENSLMRVLDEVRAAKGIFSAGFQKALDIQDFEQPILAAICSAYSDWEGGLPHRNSSEDSVGFYSGSNTSTSRSVSISLAVLSSAPLQISPAWRLPAIQDNGAFTLSYKNLQWKGEFSGTEGASSVTCPSREKHIWEIANLASHDVLKFDVQHFSGDESEPTKFQMTMSQHSLWILVPTINMRTGGTELREGALPGNGSAFLLAPPRRVQLLRRYIEREQPNHELISATGLPDDWLCVRLTECESLSPDQRRIPDGDNGTHLKPRVIRFVGGRSIRRGYSRMYLPYDLPSVELDAPCGASIECSQDIKIIELDTEHHAVSGKHGQLKPLKRYEVTLSHSRSASYELRVKGTDGSILGLSKLRIAGLGGDFVDTSSHCSMDNLGRPLASSEGLRGVSLPTSSRKAGEDMVYFDMQPQELGHRVEQNSNDLEATESFLDALAQSGSLDYGVARDLLQRLLYSKDEPGQPTLILLELRKRGHLEISTTYKGHIARIHSVTPTFYSLPFTCLGRPVLALAGTLRLEHWKFIEQETKAWYVICETNKEAALKSWRLVVLDEAKAEKIFNLDGFGYVETPCFSVSDWSASLKTCKYETFHNTMESIGSARESAKRFHAHKGLFSAAPCGNTCELWKVEDLDTGMDNLYVLAEEGKYAFVRDSRWGVWLALDSFALWVSTEHAVEGVHPVPISYDANNRTIWLPARINLPSILERALVLCGGTPPEIHKLQKYDFGDAEDRLVLSPQEGGGPVIQINSFYTGMARGSWIAYRHIPEYVAKLVAKRLGAVLDVI